MALDPSNSISFEQLALKESMLRFCELLLQYFYSCFNYIDIF